MERTSSFGYWLRRRRKALDLTQEDLAQQVACSVETIKKIETDLRRPSRQMAERLADCLAIAPEERAAFLQVARAELAPDQLDIAAQPVEAPAGAPAPAAPLPSGTVTFLFTDIEGSTRLWEQHPQAMLSALARHDAILRHAITAAAGVVYTVIGDAFQAAFPTAPLACAAALAAQQALMSEAWGVVGALPVRMALHTCAAVPTDGYYPTGALNRLGRLLGVIHGGQIVLSRSTADLVYETLPPDLTLRDLGEHQLRDLRPEHIFQLVAPDLPADFPPLTTLDRPRHNLPVQPTALIGRENETVTLCGVVHRTDVRLVTLTGPGGTGKTRLAAQAAAELLDTFADGVWFVDLAPLSDPDLVIPTILQTLGVKEQGQQAALAQLQAHLRDKQLLLVLDNFEQVVDAAPRVAELLAAAPQLKVLVTSRVVLHLRGEHEFPVPPLALPDPHQLPALETVSQYSAVALFIARAQAVKPDFAVTNQNAPAVAEICARLDGLPLAIELAAARVKLFPPQALLTRLERRLTLLTGGARDLPERQQTIRNTIDWSYALLDAGEQALFGRLGVFVGGYTLAAAEAVCNVDGDLPFDVVDGVAALVDKSLLRQEEGPDGESRFVLLETIREYALERLVEFGEAAALRQAHAMHYLALAELAESYMEGPHQQAWLTRLEADHDNLRAAIQWQVEGRNTEAALRFGMALWRFWWKHGYLSEGLARLGEILPLPAAEPSTAAHSGLRASVLLGAGRLANDRADYQAARAYLEESQTIWQELGDHRGVARTLATLGQMANDQNDYLAARATLEQSLALFQAIGDKQGMATALDPLAWMVRKQGDYQAARQFAEQSLVLAREFGDMQTIAESLDNLGYINLHSDPAQAGQFFAQSLALFQAFGAKQGISGALNGLGLTALLMGNYDEATARFTEALELRQALGDRRGCLAVLQNFGNAAVLQGDSIRGRIYFQDALTGARVLDNFEMICGGLEGLACAATLDGQAERAAHLLGAAAALHESIGMVIDPDQRLVVDSAVERARAQLGEEAFIILWEVGQAMPLEQAIAEALEPLPEVTPPTVPPVTPEPTTSTGAYPAGLTRREVEVLRLIAQGLTDAQVAERLVISAHTVHAHLRAIYGKLEVTSRTAATRFAVEHHLI